MPNLGGLEATRRIKELQPEAQVIIVSQHEAPEMLRLAMEAGRRLFVRHKIDGIDGPAQSHSLR